MPRPSTYETELTQASDGHWVRSVGRDIRGKVQQFRLGTDDILAFSRPNTFLARLGYPFVRRLQKRFARDSAAAMVRAVQAVR